MKGLLCVGVVWYVLLLIPKNSLQAKPETVVLVCQSFEGQGDCS
jgi:hypothetical protein